MREWIRVALVAASVGCVSTLLLVLLWRFYQRRKRVSFVEPASLTTMEIHDHHHHQLDHGNNNQGSSNKNNKHGNYYVIRGGVSGKRVLFSWSDHPSMAVDAVENGWSRFSFIASSKAYMPSSLSKRSSILGVCAAPVSSDDDHHHGTGSDLVEISWEVSQGSAEFMQKVRLNPGLNKILHNNNNNSSSSMNVASVIRTALPLPGPPLGNYSFPQEGYFEITILYSQLGGGNEYEFVGKSGGGEGEKTKLLVIHGGGENGSKGSSEALVHVTSSNNNNHSKVNSVEEMKLDGKEGGKRSGSVMFSLGLTAAGPVPLRVPGSYPGSIGFNSNGSVFLDGMKLVFESEKAEWVGTDKVIGCGFDPRQKKVFFTLDSELVHVIHCQSEVFGTPLYPIMAANIDIMVLVNFGQSSFKYAPANAQRTPNPCFIAPLVNSPAATLGYDDSRELFSMGRIDSQWLNRSATRGSHNNNGSNNINHNNSSSSNNHHHNNNNNNSNVRTMEFDEESEADLFEIVLDGSGKSPNATS